MIKTVTIFFFAWTALAGQNPKKDIVTLKADHRVMSSDRILLVVDATIEAPYHIYGIEPVEGPIPTELSVELPQELQLDGALKAPAGTKHYDQGFETDVIWHSGVVRFEQPLKIDGAAGNADIKISLRYQACTETYCLPPKTVSIDYRLPLPGGQGSSVRERSDISGEGKLTANHADSKDSAAAGSVLERTRSYERLASETLGSFIGLAFLTGLIALLTPCVFPMIPITVSFFTKHAAPTRPQAVKKAVVYVAGIILSFTLFGWLMSVILGASGAQNFAANPWVNLFIGALFIVFALSLFGVFEIRVPNFLINLTQKRSDGGGNLGTLFAGITFTLVSFTCTVQFVGLLMVASANGDWFLPIVGMLCFAAAFSAPFFILAIFPQYMASLPKSGGWLHETKIVMAFVEVAAAFKFFSNVDLVWDLELLTRPALLAIWIVLLGMCGIYLLGKIRFKDDVEIERVGIGRTALSFYFLSLSIYLLSGLFGNPLQADLDAYLPPADYGVVGAKVQSHREEAWIEDYEKAVAESQKTGRPMFIDFTGKTCTNCRLMEKTMFVRNDVQELFSKMVLVRLWTDFGDRQEEYQDLQQRLVGSVALPFYAIVDGNEKVIASFGGLERDPEVFKHFLNQGLTNHVAQR
jgi:thiol:disulfide interchange protein DsbD